MQASELQSLIKTGLPDAEVTVKGEGDHFEAVVISRQFAGRTMVQQHRLVYAALGDRMGGEIHALALRTLTPDSRQEPDQS
jgi:acid stress-induced BolA-like protein IbaG/YrbA